MAEGQETSDYPGSLDTWASLTDKEDLSEASDLNKIKAAIEAIQTELGTDPAGTIADLKTRLAVSIEDNGAVRNETSDPGSPVTGQMYWNTNDDILKIYDGSSWAVIGSGLSNVLFEYHGSVDYQSSTEDWGEFVGNNDNPSLDALQGRYLGGNFLGTTLRTVYRSRFVKIPGVNTVTVHFYAKKDAGGDPTLNITSNVGGQTGDASVTSSLYSWVTASVDVSGLTDGNTYDVTVGIKASSSTGQYLLGHIVGIGSS